MQERILAQTAQAEGQSLYLGEQGLVLSGKQGERTLFSGTVEAAQAALEADWSLCAAFVSRGRLYFAGSRSAAQLLAASTPSARWGQPVIAAVPDIVVADTLQEGANTALFIFQRQKDGTFRARRLAACLHNTILAGLFADPPGARLYLLHPVDGAVQVECCDPLAQSYSPDVECSLPQGAESLRFAQHGGIWHTAYLMQGTAYADGVPLVSGVRDLCLYPKEGVLHCAGQKDGYWEDFGLGASGWVKQGRLEGGDAVWTLYPEGGYFEPGTAVHPVTAAPEGSLREILSNQALLLRTLREKQELQQRTLFTLQARIQAQTSQIQDLRRRSESLQAALEALESLVRIRS